MRMPETGDRLLELVRLGEGAESLQVSLDFGNITHAEKRAAQVSAEKFQKE
jgi:hypothetical protein